MRDWTNSWLRSEHHGRPNSAGRSYLALVRIVEACRERCGRLVGADHPDSRHGESGRVGHSKSRGDNFGPAMPPIARSDLSANGAVQKTPSIPTIESGLSIRGSRAVVARIQNHPFSDTARRRSIEAQLY